jgi:hypothetical protein
MASDDTNPKMSGNRPADDFILVLTDDFLTASRPGAVHQGPRELKSEEK